MKRYLLLLSLLLTVSHGVWSQKQVIIPYYDMKKDLYGYKDSVLNMAAIPAKYTFADRYSQGVARVELNGKYGFIVFSGAEAVPLMYDDALNMTDSLAAVKLNSKWGFIDRTGNVVIPIKYDMVTAFSENRAAIFKDNYWGFIDRNGHEVIECIFGYDENVFPKFNGGLANVKFRDYWGYITSVGKIAIEFKYDCALPFEGNIAAVQKDSKWGFVDRNGNEVIPLKYDIAGNSFPVFKDGLTPVSVDNRYGYIDRKGKEVIPLTYDYTSNFEKGVASVRLGSESFYINTKGERVDKKP